MSFGAPWSEAEGWASSQATAGSTIRTKVCVPITQCSGGETPPGSLGIRCCIPPDLTETNCGWMSNFCCWGWGSEKASDIFSCRDADSHDADILRTRWLSRWGGCYWHLVAREAAKPPTPSRIHSTRMILFRNANRAKLKKSWWITPLWKEEQS